MHAHLAAAAARCTTGSAVQQWQCKWNAGWNDHTSAVYKAGYFAGRNIIPIAVVLLFLWVAFKFASRSRRSAPAAKASARR